MALAACALLPLASAGDRDPAYVACVRECASSAACDRWHPSPPLAALGWSCAADCAYHCMWRVVSLRRSQGARALLYDGKWPFVRLLGVQEPASFVFSLLNFAAHAIGLRGCWRLAMASDAGRVWIAFGVLSMNAWAWASVFHCRDVYWTQCADYFSATLLVGGAALIAALHVIETLASNTTLLGQSSMALVLLGAALFAEHVRRMLIHFDYGHHMRVNLVLGASHLLLWALWSYRTRSERPHAWRSPAILMLLAASLSFELFDLPPVWGFLDGHAFWHAITAPIGLLYWRAFVHPELQWRVGNQQPAKNNQPTLRRPATTAHSRARAPRQARCAPVACALCTLAAFVSLAAIGLPMARHGPLAAVQYAHFVCESALVRLRLGLATWHGGLVDTSWDGQASFVLREIVIRPLPADVASPPVVVDVGAHDGLWQSNSHPLLQSGWSAILFEPHAPTYDALVANLAPSFPTTARFVQAAAGLQSESSVGRLVERGWLDGTENRVEADSTCEDAAEDPAASSDSMEASTQLEARRAIEERRRGCVRMLPLPELLASEAIPLRFALLSLDVEWGPKGTALAVRQMLDAGYRPEFLIIENAQATRQLLRGAGYEWQLNARYDDVFRLSEAAARRATPR